MIKEKIEKYHYEEIILILLILSTEFSKYNEDDFSSFSESIEGRIEFLFTKDFLSSLSKDYCINNDISLELETLKILVIKQYESQWIKKLQGSSKEVDLIRKIASKVLEDLKVKKIDPIKYSEEHLNIDW
jgi:hypothetical protein